MSTAQIIWEIKAGIPPDMGFNTAGGEIVESSIALKHDGSVMVFTASENAKVTAAGLPKGISLVSLGGGKWGFKGYTVKIFRNLDKYIERLDELNRTIDSKESKSIQGVMNLLESISM